MEKSRPRQSSVDRRSVRSHVRSRSSSRRETRLSRAVRNAARFVQDERRQIAHARSLSTFCREKVRRPSTSLSTFYEVRDDKSMLFGNYWNQKREVILGNALGWDLIDSIGSM